MPWIFTWLAGLGAFLVLDALWLGIVARSFYARHLGAWLAESPRWGVAGLFYALYIAAAMVLVVKPALEDGGVPRALWTGALFGAIAYATYDLNNLATLRDWPGVVAVVDIAWGACITSSACTAAWFVGNHLGLRAPAT